VLRWVCGAVWLWAGVRRFLDPGAVTQEMYRYRIGSIDTAQTAGGLLPTILVVVGAALVIGLLRRGAGVMSLILSVGYLIITAQAWVRGLRTGQGVLYGLPGLHHAGDSAAHYLPQIVLAALLASASALIIRGER
jgi:uncharacterized membrane protein YphA (DoxX/SURF4 family)